MKGSGLQVYSNSYDNHIDTTNKLNNKSVRYYEHTPGVHLSGEIDVGQVILNNLPSGLENSSRIDGLSDFIFCFLNIFQKFYIQLK